MVHVSINSVPQCAKSYMTLHCMVHVLMSRKFYILWECECYIFVVTYNSMLPYPHKIFKDLQPCLSSSERCAEHLSKHPSH